MRWEHQKKFEQTNDEHSQVDNSMRREPRLSVDVKWHHKLEWWRRMGLDSCQDPDDESIYWRTIIVFGLFGATVLTTIIVLCFNVVPGGANSWSSSVWGGYLNPGTCELVNNQKMVHQLSTAISSFGYMFVGIFIALLTWTDFLIVVQRRQARKKHVPPRHFTQGPNGNVHYKVTAIASKDPLEPLNHPKFVSVDPDYLSGSVPALLRREPLWGLLISASINFLGVSSYLFHASTSVLAGKLDQVGWFSVAIAFTAYSVARAFVDGMSPRANFCGFCDFVDCRIHCDTKHRFYGSRLVTALLIPVSLAVDVISFFFVDFEDEFILWTVYSILAAISFVCIMLHYYGRRKEVSVWFELGLFSAILFSIALLFRHYDLIIFCGNPSGYFQAHAVWQALSAAALGFAYLAFRSDMWVYDLLPAQEERRNEALDDAYRVPQFGIDMSPTQSFSFIQNPNTGSQRNIPSQNHERPDSINQNTAERRRTDSDRSSSRPRTLESNTPILDPVATRRREERASRKVLDREDSQLSETSDRLDNLRAQARNRNSRHSRRTQPHPDSDSDVTTSVGIGTAYWTCPECAFEDNEMQWVSCERCGNERPPLDEFIPVVHGYV